jgi:hypothetical protein
LNPESKIQPKARARNPAAALESVITLREVSPSSPALVNPLQSSLRNIHHGRRKQQTYHVSPEFFLYARSSDLVIEKSLT